MAATATPKTAFSTKPMTKTLIYKTLADSTGLKVKDVKSVVEGMALLAYAQAKAGFTVPGLGKLLLAKSPPRDMVMRFGPNAGTTQKIPAKTRVKFRLAKVAKDAILGV